MALSGSLSEVLSPLPPSSISLRGTYGTRFVLLPRPPSGDFGRFVIHSHQKLDHCRETLSRPGYPSGLRLPSSLGTPVLWRTPGIPSVGDFGPPMEISAQPGPPSPPCPRGLESRGVQSPPFGAYFPPATRRRTDVRLARTFGPLSPSSSIGIITFQSSIPMYIIRGAIM